MQRFTSTKCHSERLRGSCPENLSVLKFALTVDQQSMKNSSQPLEPVLPADERKSGAELEQEPGEVARERLFNVALLRPPRGRGSRRCTGPSARRARGRQSAAA